jgi:hypothetical protein
VAHQVVLFHHELHGVSQGDGHSQGKTLQQTLSYDIMCYQHISPSVNN